MSSRPDDAGARRRAAYLGPAGTFSEEALLASACEGAVEPVACATIFEAVSALREGSVRYAVVPIENSLEGSINVTLDLLAGSAPQGDDGDDLEIVGETLLAVRHALIAAAEVPLAQIERVLTHPQVPGQCTRLLRGELAHAQVAPASSTAEAVRTVLAAHRPEQAAIGTSLAARIYGGTVLRESVEDRHDNETRFVWLARRAEGDGEPPLRGSGGGEWKTSLVFWGAGAERAGWLMRCLDEFARREINLSKIESRPRRGRLGSYMFFADLAGRAEEAPVAAALAGLRTLCEQARVLGSYRAAPPASPPPS
jgi:prephenate dehydratase